MLNFTKKRVFATHSSHLLLEEEFAASGSFFWESPYTAFHLPVGLWLDRPPLLFGKIFSWQLSVLSLAELCDLKYGIRSARKDMD